MRKMFFRALILLAILWAAGIYLFLPSTEQELNKMGGELLVAGEHKGVLNQVKVQFSGQEAALSGIVALDSEKQLAEKIITNEIRARNLGGEHNPVTAVHNEIVVNAAATSRKPQWLIVSFQPGSYTLDGVVQNSSQITKLVESLSPKSPPGTVANTIVAISETALPISDWDGTLANIPDFKAQLEGKSDKERGIIALSLCDGNWTVLPAKATVEEITAKFNNPKITQPEINRSLTRYRVWFAGPSQAELDQIAAAAKAKADAETQAKAEEEAKVKAAAEAHIKANAEAKAKAEAEAEAKAKAEAEAEAKAKAEAEAKAKAAAADNPKPANATPSAPKPPAKGTSPQRAKDSKLK